MSAHHLYDTWFPWIRELLPDERVTRRRNLCWMIVGMFLSQSVYLSKIASELPFSAKLTSTTMRFRRFLNNRAFRVRPWYRSVAEQLLAQAASAGPVRLIFDSTKIGASHQLLIISLAYRKRTLPIAWTWVRAASGHSSSVKQRALLHYVHDLMPKGARVEVVGDGGFGTIAVARQIAAWRWRYVLRQKGNTKVSIDPDGIRWRDFRSLVSQKGKIHWFPNAIVTIKHLYHTNLLAYWEEGEDEPWLLITNFDQPREALKAYRRRMYIEEMFGDWKGHGFDIEKTRVRHVRRLDRLVFVVALLYLWLVTRGSQAIKTGMRSLVDRADRRDLSIFRIGLYVMHRLAVLGRRFAIRIVPYF